MDEATNTAREHICHCNAPRPTSTFDMIVGIAKIVEGVCVVCIFTLFLYFYLKEPREAKKPKKTARVTQ